MRLGSQTRPESCVGTGTVDYCSLGEEGGARGSRTGNPDLGFQVPLSPWTEPQAICLTSRNFSVLDTE